jgi:transcriptional regulator with AAA-type ATPase domain
VFVADFYDRIAQLIIELPPLRQTPDEIVMLFTLIWQHLKFNLFLISINL